MSLHHSFVTLIHEIQRLCKRNWSVQFAHVPRIGNVCADYMAHVGAANGGGLVSWDAPERRLNMLLLADALFSALYFSLKHMLPKKKESSGCIFFLLI